MPYTIRSLDEIGKSVRGAIRQYLPGSDASLKQNVLTVIGKVQALMAREYELRLAWIFRQLFLSTATWAPIIRLHCAEYGIFAKPASAAAGLVVGDGEAHRTYPAGVRFLSGDRTYVSVAPFQANAVGAWTASVQAEQTGADTNRDEGAALLVADPALYPTLAAEVEVGAGGLGGGADVEDIESLRRRGLQRKASPPQGGALADYERWSREVPGVVAAWAANFTGGIGSVGSWVLFAGRANYIPTEADLAAVDAYIAGQRLVRGYFRAAAAIPVPVDIEVKLSPDTVAQRAAVTQSLRNFFDPTKPSDQQRVGSRELSDNRIRPGLPDDPFVLPLAWVSEAISTTPGEHSHRMTTPPGDRTFQPGELAVLGMISWV